MFFDIKKIRELIRVLEASKINEIEIKSLGRKIRMVKYNQPVQVVPQKEAEIEEKAVEKKEEENLIPIKSPMVGTFYRAPAPEAKPYVELNQYIQVGQVVCIIEAMKLMNEIESEVAGRIAKILVENEESVELGQTLFLIEPS